MNIERQEINNLFASEENPHSDFTVEEIEDILRYANEHGINSAATARFLRWIRLKRAAHNNQKPEI